MAEKEPNVKGEPVKQEPKIEVPTVPKTEVTEPKKRDCGCGRNKSKRETTR